MVAVTLPETRLVLSAELQGPQPFAPFPEIFALLLAPVGEAAHYHAQGVAMVWFQGLAVKMGGQQDIVGQQEIKRRVGGITIFVRVNSALTRLSWLLASLWGCLLMCWPLPRPGERRQWGGLGLAPAG